jgi:hypothetical protein
LAAVAIESLQLAIASLQFANAATTLNTPTANYQLPTANFFQMVLFVKTCGFVPRVFYFWQNLFYAII